MHPAPPHGAWPGRSYWVDSGTLRASGDRKSFGSPWILDKVVVCSFTLEEFPFSWTLLVIWDIRENETQVSTRSVVLRSASQATSKASGELIIIKVPMSLGLPRCLNGKEPACRCRRCRRHGFNPWVRKAISSHSSFLAWKIPWTEESGGLQAMGSQTVGHI